ncbi:glycosyltransferase [Fontibacter flavus]|uniref:Glycosyltransferase n=1 Tax=Fontibacter flavus TaxID=654838 RepID=A0ABV6FUD9_9BACT
MTIEKKEPYFSVIIPVYQDTERLLQCLDRFNGYLSMNFNFEVIVVNNDPEISDLKINPNQFTFDLLFTNEVTHGSYAARNKGLKMARGTVVGFTDSDCLPGKDWLHNAYAHFSIDKTKSIGILTGPVALFFKDPLKLSPAELYEKFTAFKTQQYAQEGFAITANWFSYKSVIQEFGGFNSIIKSNGDSELSGKISQKYKLIFSENLIVHHPARYFTSDMVYKYQRIIGGTYIRRFKGRNFYFFLHVAQFSFRRYRFFIKKLFTIPLSQSLDILKVCNAVNLGVFREYFSLIQSEKTKR